MELRLHQGSNMPIKGNLDWTQASWISHYVNRSKSIVPALSLILSEDKLDIMLTVALINGRTCSLLQKMVLLAPGQFLFHELIFYVIDNSYLIHWVSLKKKRNVAHAVCSKMNRILQHQYYVEPGVGVIVTGLHTSKTKNNWEYISLLYLLYNL